MTDTDIIAETTALLKTHADSQASGLNILNGNNAGNLAYEIADQLTKKLTSAPDFDSLLEAWTRFGYRPTIRIDQSPEHHALALAYNYAQKCRGFDVVAYTGT